MDIKYLPVSPIEGSRHLSLKQKIFSTMSSYSSYDFILDKTMKRLQMVSHFGSTFFLSVEVSYGPQLKLIHCLSVWYIILQDALFHLLHKKKGKSESGDVLVQWCLNSFFKDF